MGEKVGRAENILLWGATHYDILVVLGSDALWEWVVKYDMCGFQVHVKIEDTQLGRR